MDEKDYLASRAEHARIRRRSRSHLSAAAEYRISSIAQAPRVGSRRSLPRDATLCHMPADSEETAVEKFAALGVRGILWQLARDGQIVDVRCEMPQCYCFRGRRHFEPRGPHSDWEPTADHYPRLKMHGGHLTSDNVRLAHRLCNRRDYEWRTRINAMLA